MLLVRRCHLNNSFSSGSTGLGHSNMDTKIRKTYSKHSRRHFRLDNALVAADNVSQPCTAATVRFRPVTFFCGAR